MEFKSSLVPVSSFFWAVKAKKNIPMSGRRLNDFDLRMIQEHFGTFPAGSESTEMVHDEEGTRTRFDPKTRRLVVIHPGQTTSSQGYRYQHSEADTIMCLTARQTLKFWDLERSATSRELADLQGFPSHFILPKRSSGKLFGNAVSVPVAHHAIATCCEGVDTSSPLKFVDLCSGIGGFHFAMQQVFPNAVCMGFSEIYAPAIACYRENFPESEPLGDLTQAKMPRCDVVLAGFPCQPFSICVSREAAHPHPLNDMFRYVVDAVRDTQCDFFVLENVPTLLTKGAIVFKTLIKMMRDLGFNCDVLRLNSKDFSLRQVRSRIYILGSKQTF